ncbi:hypothetical protein ABI214_22085 [Prescottella soli]|uniref:Uncharacterized protein n=1 Tax=Prescottella soli TaxID=1543852 RepID=A0ABW9FSM1_9NOCA
MSPQEKMSLLWKRIPRKLFGGRMRTTTVVMCVLWLALATLNSYLVDQANTSKGNSQRTGVEQSQPYDPAPARSPQASTSSSTTTTTPLSSETSTSSTSASQSETTRSDRQPGASTTTSGAAHSTTTQQESSGQSTTTTESPKQTQEPQKTTAGAEASTIPSPAG